jgi:hypothetical protein
MSPCAILWARHVGTGFIRKTLDYRVKKELSGYDQKQSWMRLEGENERFVKSVICGGIWWCMDLRTLAVGEVVRMCRGHFGVDMKKVRRVY